MSGESRPAWVIARDLSEAFDPETGEVDGERWDALQLELSEKVEAVHAVSVQMRADAAACAAEARRLADRSASIGAREKRLREYALDCMRHAGTEKLRTATVTASIRKGSERVDVTDASKVPTDYTKQTTVVDKSRLKDALRSGQVIEGARLVRGAESLTFR